MAILFDKASSEYLQNNAAPLFGVPFTVACWFRSDDLVNNQALWFLGNKDVTDQHFALLAMGAVAGDPVQAFVRSGSSPFNTARSTTGYSADTWHHAAGVFAQHDDVRAFIDGGSKGTDNTSKTPTGADRVCIGRMGDSTPSAYMSGRIAELCLWDAALSDDQIAELADGREAWSVRGADLVDYYRLLNVNDLRNRCRSIALTAYNSPTSADHCRMRDPLPARFVPEGSGISALHYERKTRGVMRGVARGAA